jgi:hypothetical protein
MTAQWRTLVTTLCIATVSSLLFPAQRLRAQSAGPDSTRADSAHGVLMRYPLGTRIRITTVGQNTIEGQLATLSDTGVVIRQRSDSSRASIVRIASIWRPAANIKSGALTGGLIGAVVGALAGGIGAVGFCDAADCHGAFANGAGAGALLGAGVGAVIGIGVGALTHHWEQVWP